MLSLFNRPFRGGVHPKAFKQLTSEEPIDTKFIPKTVYLNLLLKNGQLLKPIIAVGQTVVRGQLIAVGSHEMATPLHAPVNGVVTSIKPHITSHPSGLESESIVIHCDDVEKPWVRVDDTNVETLSSDELIGKIADAGIVGLGGGGFPTSVKLRFAKKARVDTLIINGGECEPYLTCDDVTMRSYPDEIVIGVRALMKASGATKAIIAIEDNKPVALTMMRRAANKFSAIEVIKVPSLYPMGSEKHLIKAVTGKTVPEGKLATDLGLLVNNIATARAVYLAICGDQPLVDRVVTVSGNGIVSPKNVLVPIGTPVSEVIEYCGGFTSDTERLVFGGPMMGQTVTAPLVPVDKTVGGILALTQREVVKQDKQSCIRCGQCVKACPMGLMPLKIAEKTRVNDYQSAQELGVMNCLSCGACSYVCPSHIPLVQYFMHAKGAIRAVQVEERKALTVKQLSEARQIRLEQEAMARKKAKAERARPSRRKNVQNTADEMDAATTPVKKDKPARPQRPARKRNVVTKEKVEND